MRLVPRIFLVTILVGSILFPAIVTSEQLPARMDKDIFPGITYVNYAGQNFRFETTIPIHITFLPRSFTLIELKFKVHPGFGGHGGANQSGGNDQVSIYWENWDSNVYDGPPPDEEWSGSLDTESGFTEK